MSHYQRVRKSPISILVVLNIPHSYTLVISCTAQATLGLPKIPQEHPLPKQTLGGFEWVVAVFEENGYEPAMCMEGIESI